VPFDLQRFKDAQDRGGTFGEALAELRAGQKTSHWIWYVFPQLRGLGSSGMAQRFGLDGIPEAEAYLAADVLRARLCEAIAAVHEQLRRRDAGIETLMGSQIDALKLVSSLTLFAPLARAASAGAPNLEALATQAEAILAAAAVQGYPRCAFTQARLVADRRR
jgi:uncharacterized protein (DUF1810 family)